MRNTPSDPVTAVRTAPVCTLVAVTVTPGMGALLVSVMTPVRPPNRSCALAAGPPAMRASSARRTLTWESRMATAPYVNTLRLQPQIREVTGRTPKEHGSYLLWARTEGSSAECGELREDDDEQSEQNAEWHRVGTSRPRSAKVCDSDNADFRIFERSQSNHSSHHCP